MSTKVPRPPYFSSFTKDFAVEQSSQKGCSLACDRCMVFLVKWLSDKNYYDKTNGYIQPACVFGKASDDIRDVLDICITPHLCKKASVLDE